MNGLKSIIILMIVIISGCANNVNSGGEFIPKLNLSQADVKNKSNHPIVINFNKSINSLVAQYNIEDHSFMPFGDNCQEVGDRNNIVDYKIGQTLIKSFTDETNKYFSDVLITSNSDSKVSNKTVIDISGYSFEVEGKGSNSKSGIPKSLDLHANAKVVIRIRVSGKNIKFKKRLIAEINNHEKLEYTFAYLCRAIAENSHNVVNEAIQKLVSDYVVLLKEIKTKS